MPGRVRIFCEFVLTKTGIPPRYVDWKATAKSGELKVREFARDEQVRLRIVFDNPSPGMFRRSPMNVASSGGFSGLVLRSRFRDGVLRGPRVPSILGYMGILALLALAQPAVHRPILGDLKDTGEFKLDRDHAPRRGGGSRTAFDVARLRW